MQKLKVGVLLNEKQFSVTETIYLVLADEDDLQKTLNEIYGKRYNKVSYRWIREVSNVFVSENLK